MYDNADVTIPIAKEELLADEITLAKVVLMVTGGAVDDLYENTDKTEIVTEG